jgi:geranylgeranyl pyrophosphate synthase
MTFTEYLTAIKPMVDLRIQEVLTSYKYDEKTINLLVKGKRLRAALLLFTYQELADSIDIPDKVLDLAVAIEIAHGVSLIIDDMIDDDETRRGVIAHHISKGHKRAMLDSVGLLSLPYDLCAGSGNVYVHSLAKTQRSMVKGVLREMFTVESLPATKLYDAIITKKTGELFSLAAYWGSLTNWQSTYCISNEQWAAFCNQFQIWGLHVGKAMQAADDIADLLAVMEGRKPGSGTEALLLRCLTTDRLARELLADIKEKRLHPSKARQLWKKWGDRATLFERMRAEIDGANLAIVGCADLPNSVKDNFYPVAGEITEIMLKEK